MRRVLTSITQASRRRAAIVAAPLLGALSLSLGQGHVFGSSDVADGLQGVVLGVGIGTSLTVLLNRKTCLLQRLLVCYPEEPWTG